MSTSALIAKLPEIRSSTRERLLEAATRLFAANGYENTSTLSIARSAGTSETQLMKNFINKQGLLEAVLAQALASMLLFLDEVQHLSSPRDKLREFFHLAVQWFHQNPEMAKLLLLDLRRVRNKNGGELLSAPGVPDFLRKIDELVEEARDAGQIKCSLRSELIRSALLGAIGEVVRGSLVTGDAWSTLATPTESEEMMEYLLSCFLVS